MALANRFLTMIASGVIALPVYADGVVDVDVFNNELRAEIEFVNGIAADVTITFEQATGLNSSSIGLDAELIDPLDSALLARLPNTLVSPTSAFPLLLRIEPPADGGLSFLGTTSVSIHTHNLGYSVGSPFRLVVSEDGGDFEDITDQAGSGSYRVRGSQGEFCEFMIVADLRAIDDVINGKFDRLDSILATNQGDISQTMYNSLSSTITAARAAYNADDTVGAIDQLDDFITEVRINSGGAIPNLWRARDDLTNLDGQLRAAASTLRYSLTLLANDLP